VETADPDSGSAVLGCLVSYKWHTDSTQLHTLPLMTASLSWDGSPSAARRISYPHNDEYTSHMESSIRVNISSRDDYNCTSSFTFKPGVMQMNEQMNELKH